jgi:hypothetical protein
MENYAAIDVPLEWGGAHGAVRGGRRDSDPCPSLLGAQSLCAARCQPTRNEEGQGDAGAQARGRDEPHVAFRWGRQATPALAA